MWPSAVGAGQGRGAEFDDASAEDILRWGFDTFAPRIALSASFGSPGMVLHQHSIAPRQTRVHHRRPQHQETYELMDRVRNRYGIAGLYFPRAERVQEMVRAHGLDLFYDSVELRQMLRGAQVERSGARWPSSTRGSPTAARTVGHARRRARGGDRRAARRPHQAQPAGALEPAGVGLRREAPRRHQSPAPRAIHCRCLPCTRSIQPGEDRRRALVVETAGTRECGIHVGYEEKGSGI
jgi:hypothetical protein